MRGSALVCGRARRVPDTRLGPYAVTAKIGEGGTGISRNLAPAWVDRGGLEAMGNLLRGETLSTSSVEASCRNQVDEHFSVNSDQRRSSSRG